MEKINKFLKSKTARNLLGWFAILALFSGCTPTTPAPAGSGTTPTPTPGTPTVTELMNKTWTVTIVKEDATTVYTKGDGSSIRMGYVDFQLNLSSLTSAKLTAVDGRTFTGTWSISADSKTLTLLGLTPEPTDTGGTIAYEINSITDTALKLTRNSSNRKTGAAKTEYELTNK